MIFREAGIADIPVLMEIRLSVRENVLTDPRRVTREMYVAYLTESGKGWLCEVDGEVAGFCVASLADTSIWALFVRPAYEGRGIGRRLLQLAADWLFETGAPFITLSTDQQTRADSFYHRQGWTRGALSDNGEVSYTLRRRRPVRPDKPLQGT